MSHDAERIEADRQLLVDAKQRGRLPLLGVFLKLSGPGWLQSALTLGGGSLASSLYLGVLAGFSMLWLQPVAMILGVIMLSSIGYVTLSTGERPFKALNEHVNPVLGWSWALATLVANMVWCLPQFSLANGVVQQNLLPMITGGADLGLSPNTLTGIICGVILVITITITWAYDSGGVGVRLYELMLKLIVAMIVFCFIGVVVKLSFTSSGMDWASVWSGFVPDLSRLWTPAAVFDPILNEISLGSGKEVQTYWYNLIVSEQRDVMISAAATAVGINMTFLLPYSMLSRGWTKPFRGLAIFDLSTGMLIPFVLATSCVTMAAATQFHGVAGPGLVSDVDAQGQPVQAAPGASGQFHTLLKNRLVDELGEPEVEVLSKQELQAEILRLAPSERRLAAMLVRRDAFDLAQSLKPLTGDVVANLVFGIGVLGMTLSTITLLMLISGFVICEMLGLPPGGWPHRFGCLAAAVGALGPFYWRGDTQFFLAVVTSVFGMMLLPIAYLSFFLLMNQESLLGDEMPRGFRRFRWNVLMIIAAGAASAASLVAVWSKSRWYGIAAIAALITLAGIVQVRRAKPADLEPEA